MAIPVPIVHSIAETRAMVSQARRRGARIGLVPTMGALHEGHAALIRAAKSACGFVVVSVFVNPIQFGPKEDFGNYPRTLDADREVCNEAGADVIFAPAASEMYPDGFCTSVTVGKLDEVLCGASRPGHFNGVCTVVLKLFNIVQPDVAVFGAKDAQQSIILKRLVRDLNLAVVMQIEPTVREADGLARSSRNRYLSDTERQIAPGIAAALRAVEQRAGQGETDVARLESLLHTALLELPNARVDYARILDAEQLQPMKRLDRPALAAVAVFLGTTRLIDNVILTPERIPDRADATTS